jgi:hypothetical protein
MSAEKLARKHRNQYLQEGDNHRDEGIGPDAAVERLIQPPLGEKLLQDQGQREEARVVVDELRHELGRCGEALAHKMSKVNNILIFRSEKLQYKSLAIWFI